MSLPAQDRYSYDKDYMLSQISMLFGGRIAEEVFMNQMTTGASNDFRARHPARAGHGDALRHDRCAWAHGVCGKRR